MGRLSRSVASAAVAAVLLLGVRGTVAAFDGFGAGEVTSTYGVGIEFVVELEGAVPDRLELLVRTPGSDTSFVAQATISGQTGDLHVGHRERAPDAQHAGDVPVAGDRRRGGDPQQENTIRYEDDRPGLDWQSASLGEATVHWYGDHEAEALRFGEVTAIGVEQGEELLGTGSPGRSTSSSTTAGRTSSGRWGRVHESGPAPRPTTRSERSSCGWAGLARLPRAGDDPRGDPRRFL